MQTQQTGNAPSRSPTRSGTMIRGLEGGAPPSQGYDLEHRRHRSTSAGGGPRSSGGKEDGRRTATSLGSATAFSEDRCGETSTQGGVSTAPSTGKGRSVGAAVGTAGVSMSSTPTSATEADREKFVETLKAKCGSDSSSSFDIDGSLKPGVYETKRNVVVLKSWCGGLWAALREILQNVVDHLHLFEVGVGRRLTVDLNVSAISGEPGGGTSGKATRPTANASHHLRNGTIVRVTNASKEGKVEMGVVQAYSSDSKAYRIKFFAPNGRQTRIQEGVPEGSVREKGSELEAGGRMYTFVCGSRMLCSFAVTQDKLVVTQNFTFPMHPQALNTGVQDREKKSGIGAGGFGDGFKTAAIAMLAQEELRAELDWKFFADGKRISWDFKVKCEDPVANFEAMNWLNVHVGVVQDSASTLDRVMVQTYKAVGIGNAFLDVATHRFEVFGPRRSEGEGGAIRGDSQWIVDSTVQPCAVGSRKPLEGGVYIKGIWVAESPLPNASMFFHGGINVEGRDRNTVPLHDVEAHCLQALMHHHSYVSKFDLPRLLQPLRGTFLQGSTSSSSGPSEHGASTWLLRGTFVTHQLIASYPDSKSFFLSTLGVPIDAIMVKCKSGSDDPFLSWAVNFLKTNNVPVYEIGDGASPELFVETPCDDIRKTCATLVHKLEPMCDQGSLQGNAIVASITLFSKMHFHAWVSPLVTIPFGVASTRQCFVATKPMTVTYIMSVVNFLLGMCSSSHASSASEPTPSQALCSFSIELIKYQLTNAAISDKTEMTIQQIEEVIVKRCRTKPDG